MQVQVIGFPSVVSDLAYNMFVEPHSLQVSIILSPLSKEVHAVTLPGPSIIGYYSKFGGKIYCAILEVATFS